MSELRYSRETARFFVAKNLAVVNALRTLLSSEEAPPGAERRTSVKLFGGPEQRRFLVDLARENGLRWETTSGRVVIGAPGSRSVLVVEIAPESATR